MNNFWKQSHNKLYIILFIGMIFTVLMNLYQFPSVANEQPDNYTAFHRYKTDIFEQEFTQNYRVGKLTFRVFADLGAVAPNLVLLVDEEAQKSSLKENRLFDDFFNRLVGSAQVTEFRMVDVDQDVIIEKAKNTAPHQKSDKYWEFASNQRQGKPGISWNILADNKTRTNVFYFLRPSERTIFFIDAALIEMGVEE